MSHTDSSVWVIQRAGQPSGRPIGVEHLAFAWVAIKLGSMKGSLQDLKCQRISEFQNIFWEF